MEEPKYNTNHIGIPEHGLHDEMSFGKYKGQKFIDVARKDEQYITWALENTNLTLDEETYEWFEDMVQRTKRMAKHNGE